jgi:ABC-type transport system substrate-binding protein
MENCINYIFRFVILTFLIYLSISCKDKNIENNHLVFRYNERANVSSLDPAFAKAQNNIWVCNQLYNGLVALDDSLNVIPAVAKHWNITNSGKNYEFQLRKDVFFHQSIIFGKDSSRIVNAYDVEYSLNRLKDEKIASPGGWILQQVDTLFAKNDSIFHIQLKKPFPAFLGLLSMKYASIIPKEIENLPNYDFRKNPLGTGPFYFKYWEENTKLILRKNKNYFEKDMYGKQLPYMEAVAVTFLADRQSAYMQFLQGNLDYLTGLDPSYKDHLLTQDGELQKKHQENIKMATSAYLNTEYLGFQMSNKSEIYQDKRIRQALNYGFDRKSLIKNLRNNIGIAGENGFIPKGMPSFCNVNGYKYDVKKAKELVASFQKDFPNKELKITFSVDPNYLDIVEYLQREWQKIGISIKIDVTIPATLKQAIATQKVNFFRASWIADYPDAENYLSLFYSKNKAPNGPNYTHFENKLYDDLYDQSFLETNDAKRFEIYQKMDKIILEEAPIVILFYDKITRFTQKNVKDLGINPLNNLFLKNVKKIK